MPPPRQKSRGEREGNAVKSILHNRWVRIQGVATVLYIFAQIDKANIAVAFPGIGAELGLTSGAIGFAVGMFAWGYLVLQIPGGILPAVVVVVRAWFTQQERARANLALLGTPIALMIGNALCGLAVSIVGWRWMFVVTAVPSLLWCLVWWWAVEDDPRNATWLDADTKQKLVATLNAEAKQMPVARGHWFKTIWHPTVLILALYNLLGLTALWGLTFWLPSLIVEEERAIGMAGILSG